MFDSDLLILPVGLIQEICGELLAILQWCPTSLHIFVAMTLEPSKFEKRKEKRV